MKEEEEEKNKIDSCKRDIPYTALVSMVVAVQQTGFLIIPQKPDKCSAA